MYFMPEIFISIHIEHKDHLKIVKCNNKKTDMIVISKAISLGPETTDFMNFWKSRRLKSEIQATKMDPCQHKSPCIFDWISEQFMWRKRIGKPAPVDLIMDLDEQFRSSARTMQRIWKQCRREMENTGESTRSRRLGGLIGLKERYGSN